MPESIGLPQLRLLLAEGAQLIDVLPPKEYAEEHLLGATNIPLRQVDARSTSELDRSSRSLQRCSRRAALQRIAAAVHVKTNSATIP